MGTGTVTINSSRTVNVSANELTVQRINGIGYGITKNGAGTLIINTSGNYNGQTTINHGIFQIGNQSTTNFFLPTSAIFINNNSTLGLSFNDGQNNNNPTSYSVILPSYNIFGNGNILATATTGNILISSNFIRTGGVDIVTGSGATSYGIRLGLSNQSGLTKTITASSIRITGQIGENLQVSNLILSTSAVNGPITLNLQNGSAGRLYSDNIKCFAGNGTITLSGTRLGASNWNSGFSFYGGSINISGPMSYWDGQFYPSANSTVSSNLLIGSNTNRVEPSSGVSFTFINNAYFWGNGGFLIKSGAGTLALGTSNHISTATLTINQGQITRTVTSSGFTANATITPATISVDFGGSTPTSGTTYRFWNGATTPTVTSVTLTNAGGKTGSFNSTNSTLTIN